MGIHESKGKSDEWYTPKYIFDALEVEFDLDVAHPTSRTFVPSSRIITSDSLRKKWDGFIWMNPPFGNQKEKLKWIEKFINHSNGIALFPDRTSASWYQYLVSKSDAILIVDKKIKFIKPDGTSGDQPANGTTLFANGEAAVKALLNAQKNGLGICLEIKKSPPKRA